MRGRAARRVLVVVVVAAFILLGRFAAPYVPAFASWVDSLGFWGPAVFIIGYAAAVIAFVPAALLTLAAGAVFGVVRGTIYTFVAAVLGSIGAFLLSRSIAREMIERRVAGNPRFAAIDRAVEEQGLRIVFLLRLSPVFPFTLLNYALGLTRVRLGDYALASFGMIPGTLLYVYSGKLVGDVAALSGGHAQSRGATYYGVLVLGLAATVAATVWIAAIARRALRDATVEP